MSTSITEVDAAIARCLQFTDRTVGPEPKWFFTDLGAFQAVVDETRTWDQNAQDAFAILLQEALK